MAKDENDGSPDDRRTGPRRGTDAFSRRHETTANALTWTWYLLSQNPEAEAKLHEELRSVLTAAAHVRRSAALKYTEAVLAESMRLYPPAWAIGRSAVGHEFGGYRVHQWARSCSVSPYILAS